MYAEVDTYIDRLPPDQAAALTHLRALVRHHLPDHIECLSYAMPGFRQPGPKGKMVAGYAAYARNCGFYPHSGAIIPHFATDLIGYKTTPGAIQFTPDHPIPDALILRLIDARIAEIAAKSR